jgi:predicted GNAT family acetyltransferase
VTHHATQHIVDQGQRPFLHVAHGNDARRLHERLGYTVRTQIDLVLLAFSP